MSRFLFQTTFETPGRGGTRNSRPSREEEALNAAIAAARTEGYAEGLATAQRDIEGQIAAAANAMGKRVAELADDWRVEAQRTLAFAAALARSLAAKLAPALIARRPAAEVEAMVRSLLRERVEEPRIVVRAGPVVVDALEPRIDALGRAHGFTGVIVLLADESLAPGDCLVEWADGGAERSLAKLTARLDGVIAQHLKQAD